MFGLAGFVLALWAMHKIHKIEKQLKESGFLKESFNSDEE